MKISRSDLPSGNEHLSGNGLTRVHISGVNHYLDSLPWVTGNSGRTTDVLRVPSGIILILRR
jgi:hypothetical protein